MLIATESARFYFVWCLGIPFTLKLLTFFEVFVTGYWSYFEWQRCVYQRLIFEQNRQTGRLRSLAEIVH